MAFKTRIPSAAAFEPQGDDIRFTIPVFAAGFGIYIDPKNLCIFDDSRHLGCGPIGLTERIISPML